MCSFPCPFPPLHISCLYVQCGLLNTITWQPVLKVKLFVSQVTLVTDPPVALRPPQSSGNPFLDPPAPQHSSFYTNRPAWTASSPLAARWPHDLEGPWKIAHISRTWKVLEKTIRPWSFGIWCKRSSKALEFQYFSTVNVWIFQALWTGQSTKYQRFCQRNICYVTVVSSNTFTLLIVLSWRHKHSLNLVKHPDVGLEKVVESPRQIFKFFHPKLWPPCLCWTTQPVFWHNWQYVCRLSVWRCMRLLEWRHSWPGCHRRLVSGAFRLRCNVVQPLFEVLFSV